jgi:hypothetical protein
MLSNSFSTFFSSVLQRLGKEEIVMRLFGHVAPSAWRPGGSLVYVDEYLLGIATLVTEETIQ